MNAPLLRWLIGAAIGLIVIHLILVYLWGRGQILVILPWYAVVMDSVPILAALAVTVIAFGRYQVLREPTPFWIGVAFTAFALFAAFDGLTAPSILPGGRGIIARLPGTSSWFWHLMFSALALFLLAAVLAQWPRRGAVGERWWFHLVVAGVLCSIALSRLLVAFEQFLPLLIFHQAWTLLNFVWDGAILVAFAVGTVLSARRYWQTGSPLYGYLALTQLVLAFVLATDLIGTRLYDVWWYWRRVLLVGGFSVMLFGLLAEYVRLYRSERQRALRMEALQGVTEVLVHELELPRVAEVIIDRSLQVLHFDAAAVWLTDQGGRELTLLDTQGLSADFVEDMRRLFFKSAHLAARAAQTEQLQVVEDVRTSTVASLDRQIYLREGLRSLLAVPLCARGHLVGVVGYASRQQRRFSAQDFAFITPLAGLFAVVIENARLYDEVRQTLRLREEFMAAAAHELRTPVTVIRGRAQLALKTDARDEQSRVALERILNASERITHLIEDLFAVLRVRPGSTALHCERFDLATLTKDLVEQTAQTTAHYAFKVATDGPLPVDADRTLIGEVLNRLLENAMRYTPGGGQIEVNARRQNGMAVVAVTDHGLGIPFDRQPYIFEPFYELIPGGGPGYVGLVSLGLNLSKQIVEAQNGRIWCVSTPGKGSTFAFSLPLTPNHDV